MRLAQTLFVVASAIFWLLGATHALLTIRDLSNPRSFTPTDESVRLSMAAARLRLAPETTIWRAWLGFNLSHSLGLLVFGGIFAGLSLHDFPFVASSGLLQFTAVGVSVAYAVLAVRFWFWAPAVASTIGAACFLASAIAIAVLR